MNYEAAYLAKLEDVVTAMGGVVPPMTTPTSFEARSLQLLDAISAASGGGGFTYNQTAEPTPTAVGQTWRERSAGGLILGEWEWNGTYWVEPLIQSVSILSWTGIGATTAAHAHPIGFSFMLLGHVLNMAAAISPQDATNYWTFKGVDGVDIFDTRTVVGILTNGVASYVSMLAAPFIVMSSVSNNMNTSLTEARRVGSAGGLRRGNLVALYRRIRE